MSNLLKYDVIYILDPGATPEESTVVSAKIEQIVADAKGTVLKKDDWGKRRLAYAVKKHRDGHYVFFHVSVTPDTVAEITRNLRLLEKVIKFTVVKDTISHLKAKVKPPRTPRPEGTGPRPGAPRHLSHSSSHSSGSHSSGSSHSSPAPAASAPVSSAPAPKAPESTAAPSTGSTSSPQATTNP